MLRKIFKREKKQKRNTIQYSGTGLISFFYFLFCNSKLRSTRIWIFFYYCFFLVFTIGYGFYDFSIPIHPQIRCACVHIVALIKRHIHSCACVSSHARTDTEAAPHSPRTGKVVSFIQTLFSRLKSKPRGEGKKITAQTLRNLS